MEERGATEAEVRRSVEQGRLTPARFGRARYSLTFRYQDRWQGTFYERKLVEVYCIDEGSDRIVVTVVVKYF